LRAFARWRGGSEFADRVAEQLFAHHRLRVADRGFALELFYGLLRNLTLLDFWIAQLGREQVEPATREILRLGLYQIMLLNTAAHAAVFETVDLAPRRARSLVNALLRRALREKNALTNAAESQPPHIRFSEPEFLVAKWTREFGERIALELCSWNQRPALVYARINRLQISVAQFFERYPQSRLVSDRENFVTLADPVGAAQNGDCYLQDPSTAIACELLGPRPGETVLDACAAPGGKSAYLAEMMSNTGMLIAVDRDEGRLARLRDNLVRLKIRNASPTLCDWTNPTSVQAANFEKNSCDKILVDAPCSNTGTMRRRVDVRWRLRPEDFSRMPKQQLAILRAVAALLKPGGSLVYSTCSLEPEENEAVLTAFTKKHPDFRLTNEIRSLPFRDGFDGAYAARLQRSGTME
jgi:16S rRNA (cytosine967-C5)-methyltransferase